MNACKRLVASAVVVLALVTSAGAPRSAQAQDDRCKEDQKGKKVKTKKVGNVVVIVDELVICGRVPKPLALVFMAGSTINYEWENQKPAFLQRIHESLAEKQF
jgi:hypothetical protein